MPNGFMPSRRPAANPALTGTDEVVEHRWFSGRHQVPHALQGAQIGVDPAAKSALQQQLGAAQLRHGSALEPNWLPPCWR
jgi:hypothetical protein